MKHLVTIMVDGQPMTASIRIGGDMTEDSDATGEVTEAIDVEVLRIPTRRRKRRLKRQR